MLAKPYFVFMPGVNLGIRRFKRLKWQIYDASLFFSPLEKIYKPKKHQAKHDQNHAQNERAAVFAVVNRIINRKRNGVGFAYDISAQHQRDTDPSPRPRARAKTSAETTLLKTFGMRKKRRSQSDFCLGFDPLRLDFWASFQARFERAL